MEDYAANETTDRGESRGTSVISTLIVFVAALALVRWMMPKLVEEVHYAIERGKQRAQFELASEQLKLDPLANLSQSSQLISDRISPSVVHIDTHRAFVSANSNNGESKTLGPATEDQEVHGQGSGLIVSEEGEILTNYHVIQGAEKIGVTLADDRETTATVIGVDPSTDLALLKLDENLDGLIPASWGDSDSLREGAMVWAVGSPFGLSQSITFGILSAKDRRNYEGGRLQEFLQSDAAVSAGNSGGPLVDSRGNVVGINTAIVGPTYQGVSFSIPSKTVERVYQRLLAQGPNHQGWLGVRLGTLPADSPNRKGALIEGLIKVNESSPAGAAGIEAGDIIIQWGKEAIDSPTRLKQLVAKSKALENVEIEVLRQGSRQKLQVAVGARPLQF